MIFKVKKHNFLQCPDLEEIFLTVFEHSFIFLDKSENSLKKLLKTQNTTTFVSKTVIGHSEKSFNVSFIFIFIHKTFKICSISMITIMTRLMRLIFEWNVILDTWDS